MIIELEGNFYNNHSLSIVNRNLALQLSSLECKVQIKATDTPNQAYNVSEQVINKLQKLEQHIGVADIVVRHAYPPNWSWPDTAKTKVVYIQPWEYPKLPFEWQYKFETFADAVITPSTTCEQVYLKGGLNPNNLFVVPNGYDDTIFNLEAKEPIPEVSDDLFTFTFVGNVQWRKGLDILINSWIKAFTKADRVKLVVKDNPKIYGKSDILNQIIKAQYVNKCAKIEYIDRELSDKEMASLYANSDVLVQPHRAEGFGMHIQEAVASGCIPIIPDKGPTETFIPDNVGMRIKTAKAAIDITDRNVFALKPGDATTLMSTHTFIDEPDGNHLVKLLQSLYNSPQLFDYQDAVNNIDTINNWSKVAEDYLTVFKVLNTREKTRRNT